MDQRVHGLSVDAGLYATAAVALAVFDDDGVITAANDALGRMLGIEAAALPGQRLERFTSPAGRVLLLDHLLPQLRLNGRAEALAWPLRPAQGAELLVLCSAVREVSNGVAHSECAFMRMDERGHGEAAPGTAPRARLAQSEFLALASQALRTPLDGLLGFARLLAQDDTLRPDQRRQLGLIESCGHAMRRLVEQMFDIAALDAGRRLLELQPVPLAPMLRHCVASLREHAQARSLALCVDEAEPGLGVRADPVRLEQVLRALLDQALQHTRGGGEVRVWARREGTQVGIAVQDDTGFDAERLARMLQPFSPPGARGPDSGGADLAMARGLAERMNGRLELRSRPDGGSVVFTLWLEGTECADGAAAAQPDPPTGRSAAAPTDAPAASVPMPAPGAPPPTPVPAAASSALASSPSAAAAPQRRRLLYVEDNPLNVLLLQALLAQRLHWELRVAGSVEAGVADALAFPPQLMLLDMHLPDGNGIELLQRLRAQPALRGVPAIAVSADALPEDIRAAIAAGFDAYWTKPLDMERVLRELDKRLGGQAAAPPTRP
jgi:signal transduction histidine kinase/CheY-like chemotaxis protein